MSSERDLPELPAIPPTAAPVSLPTVDEPPPFWSTWPRIYLVVAGLLATEALAFWLLSRWAA